MKKIIALLTIVGCIAATGAMAQGGGGFGGGGGQQMDPAQMLEMMKQRMKPQLIEKTKLSDAEADKVLEIQLWVQSQGRGLRDLSEDERAAKQKETADERKKKLKAIPLTDDQIKAVDDFYEEMRRNRPQRGGGQ
ncbi:MAG: hypothetical protein RL372_814 [Bacteroidota bacterium]|jgi:hypothetical protein